MIDRFRGRLANLMHGGVPTQVLLEVALDAPGSRCGQDPGERSDAAPTRSAQNGLPEIFYLLKPMSFLSNTNKARLATVRERYTVASA